MRTLAVLGAGVVIACSIATAQAASVLVTPADWTGSRSTPVGSGIYGQGGWASSGFVLSWNITQNGNLFTYVYTIEGGTNDLTFKDVSHFIIEVSPTFTAANLLPGSDSPLEGPDIYTEDDGNPSMPSNVYGVKFDFGGEAPFTYTLITDRMPVWGDFYAKDGKTAGIDNVAYNAGFGTDPTALTTNFTAWVPTPDTLDFGDPGIPLPAAAWLGLPILVVLSGRRLVLKK